MKQSTPQIQTLSCKICGSTDVRRVFADTAFSRTYTSYWCDKCDLMQTLGSVESISPDYVELTEEALNAEHVFIQSEHKRPAFEQWLTLYRRNSNGLTPRAVLDIGCGIGGFLDFASEAGAKTFGFDASEVQVARGIKKHKNVRLAISINEYVQMLGEQPEFNAITMWDVFEHIRNPIEFLSELREYSDKDTLLFASVPSGAINPLKIKLAKVRGENPGLIPWEHVFYYTKKSLRNVFDQAGFEVVDIGAVKAYRRAMSAHEIARRAAHALLSPTRYAFQIYVLAKIPSAKVGK